MLHRKRGWVFAAAMMVSNASLASVVEVNVHVKSSAGKGVSDAKIRLLELSVDGEWLAEARTDESGNALLEVEGTGRTARRTGHRIGSHGGRRIVGSLNRERSSKARPSTVLCLLPKETTGDVGHEKHSLCSTHSRLLRSIWRR